MAGPISAASGRIFISYRREEAAYPAGWLYDRLADHFGGGQVFKDVDSIDLGDDFVEVISRAVARCDVLLAVIGEEWLTITDEHGRRRLDSPDDFVRLEIEAALSRRVRVIPILVDGATMPRAEELPGSLAGLVRRQALELSPARFDTDTSRLLNVLDRTLAEVRTEQFRPAVMERAPTTSPPPGVATPSRARPLPDRRGVPPKQRGRSTRMRTLLGAGAGFVLILVLMVALVLRPQPTVTTSGPGHGPIASSGPSVVPLPAGTRELKVGFVDRFATAQDNPDGPLEGFDPILFVDPKTGQPRGLDVDLANAMARKLGVRLRFKEVGHFTHSISDVTQKRVDIGMSVLRDDARGREQVDYIDYLDPGIALLTLTDNPDGIQSLGDLCGRVVVRPLETPAGPLIDQSQRCRASGKPEITLMTCPRISGFQPDAGTPVHSRACPFGGDPLQLVIERRVDAAVLDLPVAKRLANTAPVGQQLAIVEPRVKTAPYGIAVAKQDVGTRRALQSALRAVIADGTYDQILATWGLQDFALRTAGVNSGP
jgi:ABC-type amino acid transport substrate-binding protein